MWTMDLTSAVTLLSFMFLIFIISWNMMVLRWEGAESYRKMQTAALFASEALVATPGEPQSWENLQDIGNISALGFANGHNELSDAKIAKAVSANATEYDYLKGTLGLQRYNLGITFISLDRNTTYYTLGKFSSNTNGTVAYERIGALNGTAVIMHMEVWK